MLMAPKTGWDLPVGLREHMRRPWSMGGERRVAVIVINSPREAHGRGWVPAAEEAREGTGM